MPKHSFLLSFSICFLLIAVPVSAQTVIDLPLPDVPVQTKQAATAQSAASAASTAQSAANKLPTAEEIAAERARLERMRAALAAERAALEKYRAELVRRQQEAEAAAKAQAEVAQKAAEAQKAAGGSASASTPPPAKADPVSSKSLDPEEIRNQLLYNGGRPEIKGHVFYSMRNLETPANSCQKKALRLAVENCWNGTPPN